ncbi:adenosylhomocysteinase [Neltuma alba]|uniref:adenosylhomocysteinase n=1 Tax=Neltuma alba TaxID=207710 RepID=UPI0010A45454|nr:adenosylhomocysteinase-like [Prosopis alba]
MALVVEKTTGGREYKVKDLSQADLGRLKMELAKAEMPGLLACLDEFGPSQPLKGGRITVSLPVNFQTGVFIETLTALGAEVRWCSCSIFSIQDRAAAAIARDSASVFAWEGETHEEYWWCTDRALDWGPDGGPDLIVDYGGDATFFIHEGVKAEESYAKSGQLPDPSSADNADSQIVLAIIRDGLEADPLRHHKMKERLVGVSEETTIGVKRLYQMQVNGNLLSPAINITDSVTKSKFINMCGCRYALFDVIMRAMIPGKTAVVCGYGDANEGYAIALKQAGANVVVYDLDPHRDLQARLRGLSVIKSFDDVVSAADIFVTPSINKGNIVVANHVKKMKNNAIIYIMDPILDLNGNIYAGLEQSGMQRTIVNLQTHKWVSPETNSSIIVLSNAGYPSFMLSWSYTCLVVALLELWNERGTGKYENKVYALSEHLEENVSALHLAKLTASSVVKTTKKETKGQGDHVSVPIEEHGNVFTTSTVPKKGDKKRILFLGVQACSLFGIIALGLATASKIKMELSFCAIWE